MAKTDVKVNFSQILLDFYGKPLKMADTSEEPIGKYPDGSDKFPIVQMTLMRACTNALAVEVPGTKITPEQKLKRWHLGCKVAKAAINGTGLVTMTPAEVTELANVVKDAYGPVVAGVANALLTGDKVDRETLQGIEEAAKASSEPEPSAS